MDLISVIGFGEAMNTQIQKKQKKNNRQTKSKMAGPIGAPNSTWLNTSSWIRIRFSNSFSMQIDPDPPEILHLLTHETMRNLKKVTNFDYKN